MQAWGLGASWVSRYCLQSADEEASVAEKGLGWGFQAGERRGSGQCLLFLCPRGEPHMDACVVCVPVGTHVHIRMDACVLCVLDTHG